MRVQRCVRFAIGLGLLLGCATPEVETVPLCAPVAELPALPAAGACDGPEVADYASGLEARLVKPASQALVRVQFDEAARVRSLCVDEGVGRHAWSARRHLAAQPGIVEGLPPGPRCLALARLDLNRYEATLAAIRDAGITCARQRHFERCMALAGDWIVLDRVGWTRPFLFVAPEVAKPPDLDVLETGRRCSRTTHRFEEESACIQADGWEMLAPPPR